MLAEPYLTSCSFYTSFVMSTDAGQAGGGVTAPGVICIKSLASTVLDLPPSCLEFSPLHPDYFVVGTYNLESGEPESDEANVAGIDDALAGVTLLDGKNDDDAAREKEDVAAVSPESGVADGPVTQPFEDDDEADGEAEPSDAKAQERTGSLLLYQVLDDTL
jgi:hypothetical protein